MDELTSITTSDGDLNIMINHINEYTARIVGPSYIYNYNNNSITSLLDIQIDGQEHISRIAVPEYLNMQPDLYLAIDDRVKIMISVNSEVLDIVPIEISPSNNGKFPVYPNLCPACNTKLVKILYHRGTNKPYIARVCYSKSCNAFMYNNIVNMLKALQLDIDYRYMTSILEIAINAGLMTHCGKFFEYVIIKPQELEVDKSMNNENLYNCRSQLINKFSNNFKLIHVLQLMGIPLLEDTDLTMQLCHEIPLLVADITHVDSTLIDIQLSEYMNNNPDTITHNLLNSILIFFNTDNNKQVISHLVKLIQTIVHR